MKLIKNMPHMGKALIISVITIVAEPPPSCHGASLLLAYEMPSTFQSPFRNESVASGFQVIDNLKLHRASSGKVVEIKRVSRSIQTGLTMNSLFWAFPALLKR